MDLKEFCAANPDAQKSLDETMATASATAKAEGLKEGITQAEATAKAKLEATLPFLTSEVYGAPIKELACKVLSGEIEISALTGAAAAVDAALEIGKSDKAKAEAALLAETPGNSTEVLASDNGTISTEDQMQAEIAKARGEG